MICPSSQPPDVQLFEHPAARAFENPNAWRPIQTPNRPSHMDAFKSRVDPSKHPPSVAPHSKRSQPGRSHNISHVLESGSGERDSNCRHADYDFALISITYLQIDPNRFMDYLNARRKGSPNFLKVF